MDNKEKCKHTKAYFLEVSEDNIDTYWCPSCNNYVYLEDDL